MTYVYLPYDEDGLIELEISLEQNASYEWILTVEIFENKVFEDQDDPRRLCRFVEHYGKFSHVMTPMDDKCVPRLPATNDESMGCMHKVRLIFKDDQNPDRAAQQAYETYEGILFDLDEYIRAKKVLEDNHMELADEIYIG